MIMTGESYLELLLICKERWYVIDFPKYLTATQLVILGYETNDKELWTKAIIDFDLIKQPTVHNQHKYDYLLEE